MALKKPPDEPPDFFSTRSLLDENGYGLVHLGQRGNPKTLVLQPTFTRFKHIPDTSDGQKMKRDSVARECCPTLGNNPKLFETIASHPDKYNLCPQVWGPNSNSKSGQWTYYRYPNKCTKIKQTENSQQPARRPEEEKDGTTESPKRRASRAETQKPINASRAKNWFGSQMISRRGEERRGCACVY